MKKIFMMVMATALTLVLTSCPGDKCDCGQELTEETADLVEGSLLPANDTSMEDMQ